MNDLSCFSFIITYKSPWIDVENEITYSPEYYLEILNKKWDDPELWNADEKAVEFQRAELTL